MVRPIAPGADMRDQWTVAIIEPNKFEAQIIQDILRAAGVQKMRRFADSEEALEQLGIYPATLILMEVEAGPLNGVDWTKRFRRDRGAFNRKAPVLLMAHAVSRAMAESCRHAGANALIGKPISSARLLHTIDKVLAHPRPFIDAQNYVGPCRRAGIVMSGAPKRRRKSDAATTQAPLTLPQAVAVLAEAIDELIAGRVQLVDCEAALHLVQALAKGVGDKPIGRVCTVLSAVMADKSLSASAASGAMRDCARGLGALVKLPIDQRGARESIAEGLRASAARLMPDAA